MTCCVSFLHQIDQDPVIFLARALTLIMFDLSGFSTMRLCIPNQLCASSDQSSSSAPLASNMYGASSRGSTPENDCTEPDGETTYYQGIGLRKRWIRALILDSDRPSCDDAN
jgi:hypothetical protein